LLTLAVLIPVAAGAVTAVSTFFSKKAPSPSAPSAAKQAAALLNAGLTAQSQGRNDVSVRDYQQLLTIDPRNKYALYDLGLIAQQTEDAALAETEYRQALSVDPNFGVALYNLAILRTKPAPQEAVDLYRHALALNAQDAGSHLNLGFLLDSLGRTDEGTRELKLAVGIDPKLRSRVPAGMLGG